MNPASGARALVLRVLSWRSRFLQIAQAAFPRAVVVAAALGVSACATSDLAERLRAQQIAPGVHLVSGSTNDATAENRGRVGNLGIVVGDSATLLIETGTSARHGDELLALAERVGGQPVRRALITQPMPEFIFGSAALRARDIEVLAHADAAELIVQRCAQCLARLHSLLGDDEMRGTEVIAPRRLLADDTRIEIGGRALQVLTFGQASAPGDLVVFDVRTGVLFTGALVSNGRIPDVHDAEVEHWLAALDRLAALPWRVLVPGYGAPLAAGDFSALNFTRSYLQAARDYARSRFEHGDSLYETVRDARAANAFTTYAALPGYAAFHLRNVQKLYLDHEARAFARGDSSHPSSSSTIPTGR